MVHLYLRTSATPWEAAEGVELKFNPWHDPANGQFTFQGQGTWTGGGSTGGGGLGGGGGASASWGSPARAKVSSPPRKKRPVAAPIPLIVRAAAAASTADTSQSRIVVRNGYTYRLDPADRTTSVTGTLKLAPTSRRSRTAQAGAGGSDRLETDDGGHYIAVRFAGPTDTFNHFAQDANFNRGGYRVLEDGWAKDVKNGKQVDVSIVPLYRGASRRPPR